MSSPLWQTVAQPPYNLPAWSSFGQVFSHGSRKVTDTAILLTATKHPSLRSVFQQEAHTSISACSDVTAAVISSCHHVLLSSSCLTKYYGLEAQIFLFLYLCGLWSKEIFQQSLILGEGSFPEVWSFNLLLCLCVFFLQDTSIKGLSSPPPSHKNTNHHLRIPSLLLH